MQGSYIGQTSNGVLPNITGSFYNAFGGLIVGFGDQTVKSGAFYTTSLGTYKVMKNSDGNAAAYAMNFSANRSNSMYGNGWYSGGRVVPSSVGMNYYIKY